MLNPEEVRKLKLLIDILQTIWQTEPAQDDCKFGIVVKLPKKGDIADTNYAAASYKQSWKILVHCGIPFMTIFIIQMLYKDLDAKVICGIELSDRYLTRGMKTTTIIVASHGFCVPSVFVEIEFTACDDDPGHSKRS